MPTTGGAPRRRGHERAGADRLAGSRPGAGGRPGVRRPQPHRPRQARRLPRGSVARCRRGRLRSRGRGRCPVCDEIWRGGAPRGGLADRGHPAPEVFGELALLTDEPRSASVVALTPLRLWVCAALPLPPAPARRARAGVPSQRGHRAAARPRAAAPSASSGELDGWVAHSGRRAVPGGPAWSRVRVRGPEQRWRGAGRDRERWRGGSLVARRGPGRRRGTGRRPAAIRGAILRRLRAERRERPLAARSLRAASSRRARRPRPRWSG